MKTLNTMILTLGAAVLATTGLQAQTAVANVPFDFNVQNVTMPAGQYSLSPLNYSSRVIEIRNLETGKATAVLTMPSSPSSEKTGKIIFHCYGDRYFLSEVRSSSGASGHLPASKTERELQARNGDLQMASIGIPVSAQ